MVSEYHSYLSPIEEIIEEARQGRMFILVDDEDRENEGDLVIPAQMATPDAINFMAKFGRGLICLSMTRARCEILGLKPMSADNGTRMQTAFTVSIEAKEGVTTGISAADRARTVQVAIDPEKDVGDIVTPGHVFPLMARDGGTLVRAGHTEAAVDISRLAGLNPSGVICEIMNDDGTMARMPDLVKFAQFHGLKIATIADLIAYRRRHDKIVRREVESAFHSTWGGDWRMVVYVNQVAYAEHIALVKGEISGEGPVMVRVHAVNILDDVLGDQGSGKAGQLHSAMETIAAHGRGVVVLVREPRPTSLSDSIRAQLDSKPAPAELRDYGVGAQILLDLGVEEMILLSNTQKTIIGLEGFGLKVVEQRPIEVK
ncbi:Riboflavin biosynthesis protein RibBA [Magnetospirillum gryphiswaldense MSR-1]|uniref:3,4-dihydroxy-2-butanone 4-phosphate synthase n=2 Tax=Magnetospirillum gryphiswaldense TaxID=55518 RepID=V6EYV9_MAGGM|nr:3,4-dihydroxy-2-butanone-4-phosphate synthase [Magnetospirillum gryphiswaldense]AVM73589.1 Riboflavin biosynthesis protein RibBA [Magnetospirillum gryphiswaldense MSR-1]AVM77492.1 Riboflavin biosynthesis protein RibBA [Magnetospirillum gryphiswaldense]CAM74690.1 bifunctional GTP cyclohydrolase II/3,4-dihydroxy-2butanone-4-phosphate synthase [Magnetospirillum gryphiswaldense MSR-1]CDK98384.1 Riboflavin biosynthesis protein ribBA [Includes: 3,4-dihydroxy-2-butanone 4-phosphate synthase; GTP cy